MKCVACNKHELDDYAWINHEEGGVYKSEDHYNCANCGDVPKDYVDAVKSRIDALKKALHEISLASQNSMSNKHECGNIARTALLRAEK